MGQARILVSSVSDSGATGWRLLSRNNRQLASGAEVFESRSACLEALRRIQHGADELAGVQSLDLATGRWVWRAEHRGDTVAVTSREYAGRRECEASQLLFLASVRRATVESATRHHDVPRPRQVSDQARQVSDQTRQVSDQTRTRRPAVALTR